MATATATSRANVVADRGNRRIQVYDSAMKPLRILTGMGAPWSVCTTPGATQYLYSGDGNGKIYKMTLDGKLLGWGQSGLGHGQSGCLVHELHCESETVVYKGDCSTWTVSKMTIVEVTTFSSRRSMRSSRARARSALSGSPRVK